MSSSVGESLNANFYLTLNNNTTASASASTTTNTNNNTNNAITINELYEPGNSVELRKNAKFLRNRGTSSLR